jgi:hypothetical protein
MMQSPTENSKPLPGLIATLTAGFELTTSHLWLIVLPILFDVFFWLGPRLSVARIVESAGRNLARDPSVAGIAEQLTEAAGSYNLLTALSIPVIGLPALMRGITPEKVPLSPLEFSINSTAQFTAIFIILTLCGLFVTALYFGLIALALDHKRSSDRSALSRLAAFAKSVVVSWFRLLILGGFLLVTLMVLLLPLLPIAYIFALLSQDLALVVILVCLLVVITYMSMAVPSIVVDHQPVGIAIVNSVKMVRRYILPTTSLFLVVVLIGWGMSLLWHLADTGNWLTLISLAGHAFVSTALVAAIFIFYRDRSLYPRVQGI